MNQEKDNRSAFPRSWSWTPWDWQLAAVVIVGLSLRIYAALNTYVVNLDGLIYLHQARAIFFGQWERLTTCTDRYLSNFPLLIAGVYPFIGDWVIASKVITVSFGTLTIIPIYLITRRFLNAYYTGLVSLAFACIPILVSRSADSVRGPVFWFFLTLGLLFFLKAGDLEAKTRRRLYFALASTSMMLAAWGRIEAGLFVIISAFYILICQRGDRWGSLLAYLAPIGVVVAAALAVMAFADNSLIDIFRFNEIIERARRPLSQYSYIREVMEVMRHHPIAPIVGEYLDKSRNMIWLVSLGTVVRFLTEAYYYPFAILAFAGLFFQWRNLTDRRLIYIMVLFFLSMILFLILLFETWVMERRYLTLSFLPTCMFMGFGLQGIGEWLAGRFKLKRAVIYLMFLALIIGFTLPKDLERREVDKKLFADIGYSLALKRQADETVNVTSNSPQLARWVSFYANINYPGAPCPATEIAVSPEISKNPKALSELLNRLGVDYFVWCQEPLWPKSGYPVDRDGIPGFKKLGRWYHPDAKKILLFVREDRGGHNRQ